MLKERFPKEETSLVHSKKVRVRFNDCDPLQIVWHGNYIVYFEDGREAFCRKHGISYLEVYDKGYATPIVKSYCEHKLPLRYGDIATVKTRFINSPAAKIIFKYEIFNQHKELVCIGETVQVFLDKKGELSLFAPDFFKAWKKKNGLLK